MRIELYLAFQFQIVMLEAHWFIVVKCCKTQQNRALYMDVILSHYRAVTTQTDHFFNKYSLHSIDCFLSH